MDKLIETLVANIPDYKEFYTVDELDASSRKLAEEYPSVVKLLEIGKTRDNHPLYCLKIGNGSNNALMFGSPHPNEPVGTMMLEYISRQLAENEGLRKNWDYTWYIVKCWDADGTRLNENWFKGPFTLYNYARNFFRPAGHKQVDWTFPIDYKDLHFHDSLPETEAMMKLIDQVRPKFIYSLHNAGFGGVYWYISREAKELYAAMRQAAERQNVPLHLGEPEAPFCVELAPAVYQGLGIQQEYDYLEKYGVADPAAEINIGSCSGDYAAKLCNAFTLVTELPYFYDRRVNDLSEADVTRKEAVLQNLQFNEQTDQFIREILALSGDYMAADNPFKLALESFSRQSDTMEATKKMVEEQPQYAKMATVAEKFDSQLVSKFYKMLSYGMLVRANELELTTATAGGAGRRALTQALKQAEQALDQLSAELEEQFDYQVVPIKKLVAIQLECGLLVADYLQRKGSS